MKRLITIPVALWLDSWNTRYRLPECYSTEAVPQYCQDCMLLPESNQENPKVIW